MVGLVIVARLAGANSLIAIRRLTVAAELFGVADYGR